MKKILSIILMLSLAATCAFAFASCGTCAHVDADNNGVCDECEANYCAVHVDADRDGVCDRTACGSVVKCANHVDVDNDGICDTIGCSELVACTSHYDNDLDGVCDSANCEAVVTAPAASYATVSAPFIAALAKDVDSISVNVFVNYNGTELNAYYTFDGTTLHYEKDVVPSLESDVDFVEGDVTVDAQGNVVSGDATVYAAFAKNNLTYNIASGITEYEAAGNVLMIKVAAANTQAVFGQAFASDVVSVITITAEGNVATISLNYTQADGSIVRTVIAYA